METRWLPFCAALDLAAASGCVALTRVAAAVVSLLVAGCQTSITREPAQRDDDAGGGYDAGAGQSERDAMPDRGDALVEPQRDASTDAAGSLTPLDGAWAPVVTWQRQEVVLASDGRTESLTFQLGELERPVFALRTYAADSSMAQPLCFQLEEVSADAETWVPRATSVDYGDYCTNCVQRVAVGHGYGLFVLPSGGEQPARVLSIALRVALRECLTLTPLASATPRPHSLVVESARIAAPARDQTLELPVLIAEATPYTFTEGARLDRVFELVRALWRPAGIELVLRGPLTMPRPLAPVKYDTTNRATLSTITHDLKALARTSSVEPTAPWFVLTPCLVREDPLAGGMQQPVATTTHVPGGFGVNDEPDGIFVAGERCAGLSEGARYLESETLAAVMAHELGHFLGLFHVREADGRQDTLADTDPDAPNLMSTRPSAGATQLTESQISIARRHAALAVSRWSRRNESEK